MATRALFRRDFKPIPSAPTLSGPNTIVPSSQYATGFYNIPVLLPANLNGKLSGAFVNGFNMRDAVGTALVPIILVNSAGDVIGTSSLTTHAIQFNNVDPNYVYLYGLDLNNPYLLRSGSGQNGIQLASGTGSSYILQNYVIDSPGASGVTANYGTGTKTYGDLNFSFGRSFNTGQEGICYVGNTGATIDRVTSLTITDCFSYNSQREGIQVEHVANVRVSNCTCILTGQSVTAGQNNGVQSQDNNGYYKKLIIHQANGPAFNHFGHDFLYEDCYFSFFGNQATFSFIGRTDSGTTWTNSPNLTGLPVTFRRCHFEYLGGGNIAELVQVAERTANIIFESCTFSPNILSVMTDIRVAGYTNTLTGMTIGSNGNAYATVRQPTFQSVLYSDYLTHGLVSTSWHYDRRMGYRNY